MASELASLLAIRLVIQNLLLNRPVAIQSTS